MPIRRPRARTKTAPASARARGGAGPAGARRGASRRAEPGRPRGRRDRRAAAPLARPPARAPRRAASARGPARAYRVRAEDVVIRTDPEILPETPRESARPLRARADRRAAGARARPERARAELSRLRRRRARGDDRGRHRPLRDRFAERAAHRRTTSSTSTTSTTPRPRGRSSCRRAPGPRSSRRWTRSSSGCKEEIPTVVEGDDVQARAGAARQRARGEEPRGHPPARVAREDARLRRSRRCTAACRRSRSCTASR